MAQNLSKIPLYRLPLVALSVLVHCMMPQEVFRLSLVSKKFYKITKSLRKKPENLEMFLDSDASLCIDSNFLFFGKKDFSGDSEDSSPENLKILDAEIKIEMNKEHNCMNIYSEQFFDLTEYACDFYEMPVHTLGINYGNTMENPLRALDWVLNRQDTLHNCSFYCGGEEDLRRQKLTPERIEAGGRWLTIENVFDLNSRYLYLDVTSFTCENVNFFLKNWQNGGNSNLGYCQFGLNSIDIDVILNGLEVNVRNHRVEIEYVYIDGSKLPISKSYEIKRNDGTIASIVMENGEDQSFEMVVWPDWHGNHYPEREQVY
ncbi:unnamed protein product [Caenorhabditis brenneri]